uniref:Uncharacterized LOC100179974 n=1 Tax=Ciona intestinalis TaxID=7719 RepID=H2Y3P0_CIOIN|nr:uncharacterized protein LOC100179974 [Ciona intestinalis]|eukprot:XP_002131427.1 uncharacterized protein LOC100179974 [Ciona intestinalis]
MAVMTVKEVSAITALVTFMLVNRYLTFGAVQITGFACYLKQGISMTVYYFGSCIGGPIVGASATTLATVLWSAVIGIKVYCIELLWGFSFNLITGYFYEHLVKWGSSVKSCEELPLPEICRAIF